jgi:hypothetical protein
VHLEEVNYLIKVFKYLKKLLKLVFCFEQLVNLQVRCKPFKTMVIITHSCQNDEVFYNSVENFMIWESLLLCVWFLSTICYKVCEFS